MTNGTTPGQMPASPTIWNLDTRHLRAQNLLFGITSRNQNETVFCRATATIVRSGPAFTTTAMTRFPFRQKVRQATGRNHSRCPRGGHRHNRFHGLPCPPYGTEKKLITTCSNSFLSRWALSLAIRYHARQSRRQQSKLGRPQFTQRPIASPTRLIRVVRANAQMVVSTNVLNENCSPCFEPSLYHKYGTIRDQTTASLGLATSNARIRADPASDRDSPSPGSGLHAATGVEVSVRIPPTMCSCLHSFQLRSSKSSPVEDE